jgi:hypothetical protein
MNKSIHIQFNTIVMVVLVMTTLIITTLTKHNVNASRADNSTIYFPIIYNPPKTYPIPQVANTITLPGAFCPNDVAYNTVTDHLYVINTGSSDVSIVKNEQWQNSVRVGGRPTAIGVNQDTGVAYITNLPEPAPPAQAGLRPCGNPYGDGRDPACISIFNGPNLTRQIDPRHEPFAVSINPVNRHAYITDLDSVVYLLDGTTVIASPRIETPAHGLSGWSLSLTHDSETGLTYIPSWEYGILYVMDGDQFVDSFSYQGWGAEDIAIDNASGYIYITNSQTSVEGRPSNNISVLTRNSHTVIQLFTASESQYVAVNQTTGFAYITNPDNQSVTILQNGTAVTTVNVPGKAWDVEVNQETGYAFVTLRDTDKVVVFKDTAIVAMLNTGRIPQAIGVDEVNGVTYIINRTSTTAYDDLNRPYELCLDNPTVTVLR